jgi:hypothetical protein
MSSWYISGPSETGGKLDEDDTILWDLMCGDESYYHIVCLVDDSSLEADSETGELSGGEG